MDNASETDAFVLNGASVRYGEHLALDTLNLRITEGERVALVGPSGSGKTTLLRLLNASVIPQSGTVNSLGVALSADAGSTAAGRRHQSRIGLIPQDLGLVPNLRVIQNVVAGKFGTQGLLAAIRSVISPNQREREKAYTLLARVGIPEKLFERTDTLSGGQQQRVAVARALYQQPEALLADEPVSSVDPARALDTVSLLTSLAEEEGVTLVMSLHNLDLAREYFPRLIGLRSGQVAFDSPAAEVPEGAFEKLYELSEEELLG